MLEQNKIRIFKIRMSDFIIRNEDIVRREKFKKGISAKISIVFHRTTKSLLLNFQEIALL